MELSPQSYQDIMTAFIDHVSCCCCMLCAAMLLCAVVSWIINAWCWKLIECCMFGRCLLLAFLSYVVAGMLCDARYLMLTECCVMLGFCWLLDVFVLAGCMPPPYAVVLLWPVWGVLCGVAVVFAVCCMLLFALSCCVLHSTCMLFDKVCSMLYSVVLALCFFLSTLSSLDAEWCTLLFEWCYRCILLRAVCCMGITWYNM